MKCYVLCSSVTYAVKGRNLLMSRGITASLLRPPIEISSCGCGYVIGVDKSVLGTAIKILRENLVKINSIYCLGDDGKYKEVFPRDLP
ncbi:MAG: DUF3343 domain-containing protein [Bacillota bacterium]|nr:DUF3343 domain-containing protein [Bacillota bacterium]